MIKINKEKNGLILKSLIIKMKKEINLMILI